MRRLAALLALLAFLLLPLAGAGAVGPGAAAVGTEPAADCPVVAGTDRSMARPEITAPLAGAEVPSGEPVTLSARTATEGPEVRVRFRVAGQAVCAPSDTGEGSTEFTFSTAGRYEIVASTLTRQEIFLNVSQPEGWFESAETSSVTVTVLPPPRVTITVAPQGGTGPVGEPVQFRATVTAGGEPLVGHEVTFVAAMSGAETVARRADADRTGTARFDHSRAAPGQDRISVDVSALDQEASAATTFTWTPPPSPPLQVALSTSGSSGQVGTLLTWTATVTSGSEPVSGTSVRFLGQLPGAPDEDVTLTTDSAGLASHQHARSAPGTEQLRVTATRGSETATDTGSFTWLPPPEPVLKIQLAPKSSSGAVGSTLDWTATVTLDGEPQSGAAVDFRGELTGQSDIVAAGVLTNSSGVATHRHSRDVAGTEQLTVATTVSGEPASDTGRRVWQPVTTTTTTTKTPGSPTTTDSPTTPGSPTTTDSPTTPGSPTTTDPPTATDPPTTPGPTGPTGPGGDGRGPTTMPPTSPPPPPPPGTRIDEVGLGRASVIPGGDLAVHGSGCAPGSTVEVTLAGETVATTTADRVGRFAVRVAVPTVPLGQYVVGIRCGDDYGDAVVDLVATVGSATAPAAAVSAAAVLGFFVLLGSTVLKGTSGSAA